MRLVIIDDDLVFRQLLELALGHSGFETLGCDGAEAHLKSIQEFSPDIILCDLYMPVMDGIEVVQWATKALPAARFIGLSGAFDRFVTARHALSTFGAYCTVAKADGVNKVIEVVTSIRDEMEASAKTA